MAAVRRALGEEAWQGLRGARLLFTGGTGFVGSWMLASLLAADEAFALGVEVTVLSRDPEAFARRHPALAGSRAVRLVRGDVRDHRAPGAFTHLVHAATSTVDPLHGAEPERAWATLVDGTRNALRAAGPASRVLLLSSGAVYGRQPPALERVSEDYLGAPDPLDVGAVYGVGKRASEHLGAVHGRVHGAAVMVARGFAFVGPGLPLDRQFAVGNFLADALAGRPIEVRGDGRPLRSYMYAADLAAWLWVILLAGEGGRAYNVGSERPIAIGDLARLVAEVVGGGEVRVLGRPEPGTLPPRYVPDTRRAREELGLEPGVELREALRRTVAWHRALTG